jgi:phosphoribosylamine---glycine ligase
MKILFVSKNLIAVDMCRRLLQEGNEVKLFIQDKNIQHAFDGIVEKTNNWKQELDWVTRQGIIIFDDIGFGKEQDGLRNQGYCVVGGSEKTDQLEQNRVYAQQEFQNKGFTTAEIHTFTNPSEALLFVQKNRKRWVIKQNNSNVKELTYVGEHEQGGDVIALLELYQNHDIYQHESITLHEYVDGIEIGIGRYFNGSQWVGPIEINCEHKKLFPGNIGPITGEMGTLAWFTDHEGFLFHTVLAPWEEFLQQSDFRGDFEINCIIKNKQITPIEITPRFGSPITFLQEYLITSSWTDFLYAVGSGSQVKVNFKNEFGIVQLLAIPPFPYHFKNKTPLESKIFFDSLSKQEMKQVHFDEVYYREKNYYSIDGSGHALYVTGSAKTISEAQNKNELIIKKIILPKKMYRNDIGTDFETMHKDQLIASGILSRKDLPVTKKAWFL